MNYRSQVAQKHRRTLRDLVNFEEKAAKKQAEDSGAPWKDWSHKKVMKRFAERKNEIVFVYPATRP